MKQILLIPFAVLIAISCKKYNSAQNKVDIQDTLNAWVKVQVSPSDVEGVWFVNQNKGVALVDHGGLYSSSDGGTTWNSIPNTLSISAAYNLQFIDSLNGFAQGPYLWATNDGGVTWTQRSSTESANYFQFISITAGFYFNQAIGISATHDGGNSWGNIFKPTIPGLSAKYPFYFLDSLRGFSMMNGNFCATVDGGLSWSIRANVSVKDFTGYYKMQFLDSLTGYSGTPDGLIKTSDGGKTWVNCFPSTNSDFGFLIPRFFDSNNGYFMTDNGIYKTKDGG